MEGSNCYRGRRNETVELCFTGKQPEGSLAVVDVTAEFDGPDGKKKVRGFYAGNESYKVRFLPEQAGTYTYRVSGVVSGEGTLEISEASEGHHGVVRAQGLHFEHQDGTPFYGFGTTVYALAHQSGALMDETIESLSKAPFNKVRMCVFPKSYQYNVNEPAHYAFCRKEGCEDTVFTEETKKEHQKHPVWDVHHPKFAFWDAFEARLQQLFELGIQVDLILFHPYDRWGFSSMSREDNLVYLDYVVRRFSAFPNLWWSLANEYDLCGYKTAEDWDAFGAFLLKEDVYRHLVGNHNCFALFDHSKPYITHVSLQNRLMCRVSELQKKYGKPVCYDECCYEGNLNETWGNISGEEMTRRFWQVTVTGGCCTHGETFLDPAMAENPDAVVWWAKGGKLIGESPKRIAFLRDLIESLPGPLTPYLNGLSRMTSMDEEERKQLISKVPEDMKHFLVSINAMDEMEMERHYSMEYEYAGHIGEDVVLFYNDIACYGRRMISLPGNKTYRIEAIDTWNMTREVVATGAKGEGIENLFEVRMPLPARPYMAILCTAE